MQTGATEWVSRPAAARACGISPAAIDRGIAAGRIECRRPPGSHPRVKLADVEAFAAGHTTELHHPSPEAAR